jgi:hypothetical protein
VARSYFGDGADYFVDLGTRFDADQQCQVPDIYLVSAAKWAAKSVPKPN